MDDTALAADSEEVLQGIVREFGYVCKKRKLKAKVSNGEVIRIIGNSEENAMNVSVDGKDERN